MHINMAYQQVHKLGSRLTFFATPCMLFNIFQYIIFCVILQHILELLQINGNRIVILRFCFTLQLLEPDKYKLKVNKRSIIAGNQNPTVQARTQQSLGKWSNESNNMQHR